MDRRAMGSFLLPLLLRWCSHSKRHRLRLVAHQGSLTPYWKVAMRYPVGDIWGCPALEDWRRMRCRNVHHGNGVCMHQIKTRMFFQIVHFFKVSVDESTQYVPLNLWRYIVYFQCIKVEVNFQGGQQLPYFCTHTCVADRDVIISYDCAFDIQIS